MGKFLKLNVVVIAKETRMNLCWYEEKKNAAHIERQDYQGMISLFNQTVLRLLSWLRAILLRVFTHWNEYTVLIREL